MRSLMVLDAEAVVGPCADVPVPPAARPRRLVRGAVHPAVRDAQRRLNAFSAAEVAAGRAGLAGAPLVEDCVFGKGTQQALIAFQQLAFPGVTAEHDGRLGPKTWAEFDRVAGPPGPGPLPSAPPIPPSPAPPPFTPPAPPSPALTGPKGAFRPCCLLEPHSLTGRTTIGHYTALEGKVVYTGKAGFVDLGHLWDTCDVTAFAYQAIHGAGGASGTRIPVSEGTAVLTRAAPAAEWLDLARAIANDDALVHEIVSYPVMDLGQHHSSFSPEDLCSNNLGTVVAARALTTGGPFVAEAERQVAALLTDLDGQTEAQTRAAFARIARRWVDDRRFHFDVRALRDVPDNNYLLRRNFTGDPWKTGHSSDAPTPAFVVAPITLTATYDFIARGGGGFHKADVPAQIATIRTDARTRYGPDFDKP